MKKTLLVIVSAIGLLIVGGVYLNATSKDRRIFSGLETESRDRGMNIELKNYGPAPDFAGIQKWLNSEPLTMQSLRGKVVLIDFWTYSCINCIRTLPYVTKWYDTYKDQGFVVVGVHTPEFAFEQATDNVATAIQRYNIHYPVAQDNDYATWNNYNNRYWPAEYLVDKNGNVVYAHFGEGNYDLTENRVRQLLGINTEKIQVQQSPLDQVKSPEMYFGTKRLEYLTAEQHPSTIPKNYTFPQDLSLNNFALSGTWQFTAEGIKLEKNGGKIRLKFHSGKVHMVAASSKETKLHIQVDGQDQPEVNVKDSRLYTLFDSADYVDHVVEITVSEPGFEAFVFTFG